MTYSWKAFLDYTSILKAVFIKAGAQDFLDPGTFLRSVELPFKGTCSPLSLPTLCRPAGVELSRPVFHSWLSERGMELLTGNMTVLGSCPMLPGPLTFEFLGPGPLTFEFLDWPWHNIRYFTVNCSLKVCLNLRVAFLWFIMSRNWFLGFLQNILEKEWVALRWLRAQFPLRGPGLRGDRRRCCPLLSCWGPSALLFPGRFRRFCRADTSPRGCGPSCAFAVVKDPSVAVQLGSPMWWRKRTFFTALSYFINVQAKGEMFIFLEEGVSVRHILNVLLPSISVNVSEMFPSKWNQ